MTPAIITAALLAAGLGATAGYLLRKQIGIKSRQSLERKIELKLKQAKKKVKQLREQAEREARDIKNKAEGKLDVRRQQLVDLEKRVADREDALEGKISNLEKKESHVRRRGKEISKQQEDLKQLRAEEEERLTEISRLNSEQAEIRVMELAEERTRKLISQRLYKLEREGEKQFNEKAQDILSMVIQRYAGSHVSETTTSHVHVEDENLIGRVIGKEGRNIQHLERLTGCEIIVDETPNSIMVSGFSPTRRQVAKRALERLLADGRIHPGRIEEVVKEAKSKTNEDIREAGEAVVYDVGIVDLPDQLVQLLGRLKYRTSYRQNVLKHSWEATCIASMLAQELGADVNVVKKAALLHDIGKAIDHEVEGNHVEVGEKIMKKFGIDQRVIEAACAHHSDPPFATKEALIVQVADAISATRPGARRDTAENYIKRMEELENIATSYEGINKAYAIYAGREVRVFVNPQEVDDLKAIKIAQSIAQRIEQEVNYPGEVKVNVIRETRAESKAK